MKSTNNQWEEYFERQLLSHGIPQPIREFRFLTDRKFRFDFAWPSIQLAMEVDGAVFKLGGHTSGAGYTKDCEKFALATLDGWRVIRVTTGQVSSGQALLWLSTYFNRFSERFHGKVNKESTDVCWEWTGPKQIEGYGEYQMCMCTKNGVASEAYKVSYFLTNGELPAGHTVKQTCSNVGCVNPTHTESVVGPGATVVQEKGKRVRLTDEQVAEIIAKFNTGYYPQAQLAKDFKVSVSKISSIIRESKLGDK